MVNWEEFLRSPGFMSCVFCLLSLWPLLRVLRRVGLPGGYAWLIWLNLLLPGLGLAAVLGVLCHKTWPHYPKPVKWRKTSIWGQS